MLYAFMTLVPSINYVVFPCVQVTQSILLVLDSIFNVRFGD